MLFRSLTAANRRGATLVLETGGGKLEQTVGAIKGDPELPMTAEDVRDKFLRYAVSCVGEAAARAFCDAVIAGDADQGMAGIWALLGQAG